MYICREKNSTTQYCDCMQTYIFAVVSKRHAISKLFSFLLIHSFFVRVRSRLSKCLMVLATSDSSAVSKPRRVQSKSEIQCRHLARGWSLDRFPMSSVSRTRLNNLNNLSWDTVVTWPNQGSSNISIQRIGVSTFMALRTSQLRTFSSVTSCSVRKIHISGVSTWDSTVSVTTQNSWL